MSAIPHMRALGYFVQVVEQGSISAAARALSLSPSVVSKALSDLESRFGASLLYRDNRRIDLTPEGRAVYSESAEMVRAARAAMAVLEGQRRKPEGLLRITAPTELADRWLPDLLCRFRGRCPKVDVETIFSDTTLPVRRERIDLALRFGGSAASVGAMDLGRTSLVLVASPELMGAGGDTNDVDRVERLPHIGFLPAPRERLELTRRGRPTTRRTITIPAGPAVNSGIAAIAYARAGLGTFLALEMGVERALKAGDLVRLLPGWDLADVPVQAVFPFATPGIAAAAMLSLLRDAFAHSPEPPR